MKRIARMLLGIVWLFLLIAGVSLAEEDRGGKDHPLFNRMTGTWIYSYENVDFHAHIFKDEKGKEVNVEGHYYYIHYYPEEGKPALSKLKILRNYENANELPRSKLRGIKKAMNEASFGELNL